MATEKTAAVLTIKNAADMSPKGRREIADWLREQAKTLEAEGVQYSSRFRARYLYRSGDDANG